VFSPDSKYPVAKGSVLINGPLRVLKLRCIPKAALCLQKDRVELLAFYDFPAQHWQSIRTSNPIESTFGTIRHRTKRSKGWWDVTGKPLPVPEVGPSRGMYYQALISPLGGMVPGNLAPQEAKLLSLTTSPSNQLLAAMRGAQVGPADSKDLNCNCRCPANPVRCSMKSCAIPGRT
jgi:hypothetical protein